MNFFNSTVNMFIQTLENKFDDYFHKKYPEKDLNDPNILMLYREELENFSDFLVEAFVEDQEMSEMKRSMTFGDKK